LSSIIQGDSVDQQKFLNTMLLPTLHPDDVFIHDDDTNSELCASNFPCYPFPMSKQLLKTQCTSSEDPMIFVGMEYNDTDTNLCRCTDVAYALPVVN